MCHILKFFKICIFYLLSVMKPVRFNVLVSNIKHSWAHLDLTAALWRNISTNLFLRKLKL